MIELFETDRYENDRHSSKGNQLKWKRNENWYKADNLGYEGLAEMVVSFLLAHSDLEKNEYVTYGCEQIRYKKSIYNGAVSRDFLQGRGELITIERLYKHTYGRSLYESVFKITDVKERLRYMVESVQNLTGLTDFGVYISKLLTVDAFFLNDDRHMHNIAVIRLTDGGYDYCPIFDNGGALLSDTSVDYPMGEDIYTLIDSVRSKTVSTDFVELLDAAEELYGYNLKYDFGDSDIVNAVGQADMYSEDLKERVINVLREQRRKYKYLSL